MVLAVAVGIGAYMVVFTLNFVMGGDPIPNKSDQLFHVQLDLGNPAENRDPPNQLTYLDASALFDSQRADRSAMTSKFSGIVQPSTTDIRPFDVNGRGATADFFSMFEVPFLFGGAWDSAADSNRQQVAVISRELNDRLFGGIDSVGETVNFNGNNFQVVGVSNTWNPMPKYYDVNNGGFDQGEEFYIPWYHVIEMELPRSGNTNCYDSIEGEGIEAFLNSECTWIQYWVELPSLAEKAEYLDFVNAYTAEQKQLGRFEKPLNNHLWDVNEWLGVQQVQPDETKILAVLAAMLLAVCLLNTIGLLLSKFLGKSAEIGVRQALGAHKGSLFIQHVIEAGFIGLVGGVLGLGLAALGLEGVKILLGNDLMQSDWIHLNMTIALYTVMLAIAATIIAGLYPIWRACNINPAIHLKTQ